MYLCFVVILAFVAQPTIKGRNPLSEKALAQTTWIEEFDISADGKQMVFKSARGGVYNLWTVPVAGGEPKQLTSYKVPYRAKNPRWSPDGKWIAYQVDENVPLQSNTDDVYVISAAGGNPKQLTDTQWSNDSNIVWSPDSKEIAFTSGKGNWQNDTKGLLGGGILAVDIATGKLRRISASGGSDLQWSPDGRYIVYSSNRVRDPKTWFSNADLYMVPAAGGPEKLLTTNTMGFKEFNPQWSPDSKRIAYITDRTGFDNLAVMNVDTGETKTLTETRFDHALPRWSPDGRTIAYDVIEDYNYYIETVCATGGRPKRITTQKGVNGGSERNQTRGTFSWLPDGREIAYTHMSPANTSDLWVINTSGGLPRRVTDSRDPSLRDESRFTWPELFKYKSFDGLDVQGFVYKPKGVVDGDAAPFLIFYRANDTGQHPVAWQPYIQYYVSKGYVVFAPNFRGSSGQGKAYLEANWTWGGDRDLEDAFVGMDLLIKRKLIDPNRMGIVGGSTGGFFVNTTLIKKPTTFKAAVSWYTGGADMAARAYMGSGGTDFGWTGHMMGGNSINNPKNFYDRSLIFFVERVTTPIIFLYAEGDVYFDAVRQIVPVLDHYRKEYAYKLYDKEPHGWYHWRPEHVEDSLNWIGDFLDQKILGISRKSN